jgi:hypothetical protein
MRDMRLGDNYCKGSGRAFGAATLVNHFRNIMIFVLTVLLILSSRRHSRSPCSNSPLS